MLNKLILLFDFVFYYKKHRQMNTKVDDCYKYYSIHIICVCKHVFLDLE